MSCTRCGPRSRRGLAAPWGWRSRPDTEGPPRECPMLKPWLLGDTCPPKIGFWKDENKMCARNVVALTNDDKIKKLKWRNQNSVKTIKFHKYFFIYSVVPKWKLALKNFCFIEGMMIGLGKRSPENMFRQNAYLEDTGKQKCFESVSIRHLKHQQMIVMIYLLISKESWWVSGKEIFYWTNWNWSPHIFWQVNIYKILDTHRAEPDYRR